ncbi:hypothetical protein HGP17_29105 [Rhizobium sp. P38BS-XIX]|uniref:hypothetical protein n=1 Tax=Rhizobium sp. P38BS-XIX TaxID=2726740 RepID=UPI0014571D78|nr:hypothetical protein [Rhizobium sp. P38BS-XIX]NLS00908.1 hypothetical protein [Rhizobium sp. P38BS-XIX]
MFSGSSFDATGDNPLSCCGRYNIKNSLHQGIAGVVDDGSLIFAVNSWVSGHRCTVMGAFDPSGKPVAPTKPQQDLLKKYFTTAPRPIILDSKTKSDIGFKTNGTNPIGGIYVGKNTVIFDIHGRLSDGNRSLDANATITTDFDGKVKGQAYSLAAKDGPAALSGSYERNGTATTEKLEASYEKWSLAGQRTRDGGKQNRQLDLSFHPNDRFTVKASWRPDVKPPTTPPRIPTFGPGARDYTPPNYSNYMITLEIKLP